MLQLLNKYIFCSSLQRRQFLSCNQVNNIKDNKNQEKTECQIQRSKNRAEKISLKKVRSKVKRQTFLLKTNSTQKYFQNSFRPANFPLKEVKQCKLSANSVAYTQRNNSLNKLNGFQVSFGQQRKCLLTFQRIQNQLNPDYYTEKICKPTQYQKIDKISNNPLNNISITEDCSQPRSYKQSKSTQQFLSYDLPFSSQTNGKYIQRTVELNKSPQLSKELDVSLAISVQPDYQDQYQIGNVLEEDEKNIIAKKKTSLDAAQSFISNPSSTSQQESFVLEDQEGYLNEFRIFLSNQ